ncbi:hypothetical protein M406DRAFT_74144 [Cryphonectria parasitica EP155]|uniref:Uncharacterized protein n=1 Tax=Cryphonectria parasitica (strain ATCC 38755 / EP155) TaxID=660469 RepID=A0A9P4XY96_CRYP1|nr:uncharacterized protein M406DRAFT_74144 [Cryphonectria parasitica EP155]KAF3763552.1 hypothetical protein M406DRAFT_74144 [Cryphonectria parasitica EP155]
MPARWPRAPRGTNPSLARSAIKHGCLRFNKVGTLLSEDLRLRADAINIDQNLWPPLVVAMVVVAEGAAARDDTTHPLRISSGSFLPRPQGQLRAWRTSLHGQGEPVAHDTEVTMGHGQARPGNIQGPHRACDALHAMSQLASQPKPGPRTPRGPSPDQTGPQTRGMLTNLQRACQLPTRLATWCQGRCVFSWLERPSRPAWKTGSAGRQAVQELVEAGGQGGHLMPGHEAGRNKADDALRQDPTMTGRCALTWADMFQRAEDWLDDHLSIFLRAELQGSRLLGAAAAAPQDQRSGPAWPPHPDFSKWSS